MRNKTPGRLATEMILAILVCALGLAGLAGCGGIATTVDDEPLTTTVIVECVKAGTDEFLEVPADVVVGGIRGQIDMQENWVILQDVPLGTGNPPRQPLTATAPGYVSVSQMVTLNEYTYTTVSVELTPADSGQTGTVSGMVFAAGTGEPIANAFVSFLPPGGEPLETVTGFTDLDGFYIIGGIPAGPSEVTCQATGYLEETVFITVVADDAGDNDPLDFALVLGTATVTVRGTVLVLRTEMPVADAVVQISDQPPVISAADGTFAVPNVTVGEQPVTANAEGYDPYYTVINVVPGIDDLRILLTQHSPEPPTEPYTITGYVTLLGAPDNSGARVTAFELDRAQLLGEDLTDAEGRYYLFVPPGRYRIEVTYGTHTIGREVELGGGGRVLENINFTLTVQ